ncbi:OLC1v1038318C3 [Oldenlandia corymbosa var. corymbosa]|nr:OLC1v1038318C3 [Oldenlandia corymbosa var. corymbosa]
MKLILSHDFPHSPPKGYFLTKIFHPNIATNGEICVNALKRDWNPSLGLRHVLMVIRCLLIEPFPESALNEQAGKMLLENYEEYARHARIFTGIHALKPRPKSKTGAISESTTALNVDQLVNVKNKASGAALPLPPHASSVVASSNAASGTKHDLLVDVDVSCNAASAAIPLVQKKEILVTKVPAAADKKKMDARKKSLKRL